MRDWSALENRSHMRTIIAVLGFLARRSQIELITQNQSEYFIEYPKPSLDIKRFCPDSNIAIIWLEIHGSELTTGAGCFYPIGLTCLVNSICTNRRLPDQTAASGWSVFVHPVLDNIPHLHCLVLLQSMYDTMNYRRMQARFIMESHPLND